MCSFCSSIQVNSFCMSNPHNMLGFCLAYQTYFLPALWRNGWWVPSSLTILARSPLVDWLSCRPDLLKTDMVLWKRDFKLAVMVREWHILSDDLPGGTNAKFLYRLFHHLVFKFKIKAQGNVAPCVSPALCKLVPDKVVGCPQK